MYIVYKYKQKVYTFYVIVCNTGLMEGCFVLGFKAKLSAKNRKLHFVLLFTTSFYPLWSVVLNYASRNWGLLVTKTKEG